MRAKEVDSLKGFTLDVTITFKKKITSKTLDSNSSYKISGLDNGVRYYSRF